jgi:hypothetical protein
MIDLFQEKLRQAIVLRRRTLFTKGFEQGRSLLLFKDLQEQYEHPFSSNGQCRWDSVTFPDEFTRVEPLS